MPKSKKPRDTQESLKDRELRIYKHVWNDGPYTSFCMLEYLIDKSIVVDPQNRTPRNANMKDFLRRPEILQEVSMDDMERDSMSPDGDLYPLFAEQTGFCTSLAIKVARELQKGHENVYDFVIHDMDDHRIALCKKTLLLIDSEAGEPLRLKLRLPLKVDKRKVVYDNSELRLYDDKSQVCGMWSLIRGWRSASICNQVRA